MNLADALVSKTYENGEQIIKQGKLPVQTNLKSLLNIYFFLFYGR